VTSRLTATPEALALIERLRSAHGALVLFLSGGCCEGSVPMCLHADELSPGPHDVLVGEAAGVPLYVDADQDARWGRPPLVLDVGAGASDSLSLEGPLGVHLIARAPAASVT
jgi:uncharacterized protein (DUF779 family)